MAYPPIRPFARGLVPAPTGPESVALDRHAIDTVGVPQAVLMENAGRSAAAVLQHLYPHGSVLGLIGAGNNGGDALVLLRTLKAWGRGVRGILVADRSPGDPLLHGWSVPLSTDGDMGDKSWEEELGSTDIIVDGILGTGVRGAPRKRQAAAIERVNNTFIDQQVCCRR